MDVKGFVQQELANVIWAYGTLKYRQNATFMQRAAQEMLERGMHVFMPQAISNACWAFAKHDLVYHEFLEVPPPLTPFAAYQSSTSILQSSCSRMPCLQVLRSACTRHDRSPVCTAVSCNCI